MSAFYSLSHFEVIFLSVPTKSTETTSEPHIWEVEATSQDFEIPLPPSHVFKDIRRTLAEENKADFAHRLCCCVSFHYQIFKCSTSHLPFCSTVFNLVSYNSSLVAEPTTAKSKCTHVTNCLYESCNSESTF